MQERPLPNPLPQAGEGAVLSDASVRRNPPTLVIPANSACAALAWVFLRRTEFAQPSCFAPSGESLLSVATKGTKKACPAIRARQSRATLANSPATEARPEGTSL
ncbi:hypothetical protein Pssp01_04700 [Pseudomonas sp. NBRC 100443]|nr:hypothetical protein Pssp01_04700 [Pseudomonas sp. NBRC 100443]